LVYDFVWCSCLSNDFTKLVIHRFAFAFNFRSDSMALIAFAMAWAVAKLAFAISRDFVYNLGSFHPSF